MRATCLSLFLFLLAPPALAQQPEASAPEAIGQVLTRARDLDLLGRLPERRFFRTDRDGQAGLVIVEVTPTDAGLETMLAITDGATGWVERAAVSYSGHMLNFTSQAGAFGQDQTPDETWGEVIDGDTVLVTLQSAAGTDEEERPWDPKAAPDALVHFVLPCLFDLLPPSLEFRGVRGGQFDPPSSRIRLRPNAQGDVVRLDVHNNRTKLSTVTVSTGDHEGEIVRVELMGMTIEPITVAEGEALLDELVGE